MLETLAVRDDVYGASVLYAAAEARERRCRPDSKPSAPVVERVALYRSVPEPAALDRLSEALAERPADLVTFTSASAVRSFADAMGAQASDNAGGVNRSRDQRGSPGEGMTVAVEAARRRSPGW